MAAGSFQSEVDMLKQAFGYFVRQGVVADLLALRLQRFHITHVSTVLPDSILGQKEPWVSTFPETMTHLFRDASHAAIISLKK